MAPWPHVPLDTMQRHATHVLALLSALVLVTACGDSDSADGDPTQDTGHDADALAPYDECHTDCFDPMVYCLDGTAVVHHGGGGAPCDTEFAEGITCAVAVHHCEFGCADPELGTSLAWDETPDLPSYCAPDPDACVLEPFDPDAPLAFPDNVFLGDQLVNIAHRGGAVDGPEETLIAYELAVDAGAHALECDAHATSDGVVVCIHDATVNRTTDGEGSVRNMTLDEVRALDAGYAYTDDEGNTPYRGVGAQVATLEELLTTYPEMPVALEIKQLTPPIEALVVDTLNAHDALGRTMISSFSDDSLEAVRCLAPDAVTVLGTAELLAFNGLDGDDEAAYEAPAPIVQVPDSGLDQALVDRAHRLGMRIQVWTVNDADELRRFVELGVDAIYTDDPGRLSAILAE